MNIMHVHPLVAQTVFSTVPELIEKAAAPTPETPASLLRLVKEQEADLWVAGAEGEGIVGVGFGQVLIRPKDKVYNVLAVAGVKGWKWMKQMHNAMAEDARARGAEKAIMVRMTGRRSYRGSKPAGYYYEDDLNVW